ncbi:MAG TPA: HDIG domain-containing protein [Gemmatimonadaceae bacterium]|nr:HDIG domain-containing protein [Gemmatimonadaceae bacterium]
MASRGGGTERTNGGVIAAAAAEPRASYHAKRAALLLGLAVATYALFPAGAAVESPIFEVGSVATRDIIAPFAFTVPKPADQLARERDDAMRSVRPVLVYRAFAVDSTVKRTSRVLDSLGAAAAAAGGGGAVEAVQRAGGAAGIALAAPEAQYLASPARRRAEGEALRRVFERQLAAGVVAALPADARGEVIVRRAGVERVVLADSIVTFAAMAQRVRGAAPDGSAAADAVWSKLLGAFFEPSLVVDQAATDERRASALASVPTYLVQVRDGEKIVGAHEVVGRAEYEKMRALHDAAAGRHRGEEAVPRLVGAILYDMLLLAIFWIAIVLFRPALYGSMPALGLFAAVFLVVIAAAAAAAKWAPERPELVPVAFAAVILSIVFDPRISLVAAMILAVLVGGQAVYRGTNALFINLVGGSAAALSARVLLRRTQTYQYVLTIAGAYLAAAVAIGLTLGWSAADILRSGAFGVGNAVVSVAFAVFLIPLAERLTGVTSHLTLIEYSDLNRPLLRRLSMEAPGTYAHTIAMANLVEAACNAIGANGLLGRVGAYYHDIGKLKKPQYFVENQGGGRNPHDKLKPGTSAQIIRGHVKEGLDLAAEHRIPAVIAAFIPEHHGTTPITFFYEKAKERDGASGLNPGDFAYPGPVPQSAETAICMLADAVEASVRVLSDPTPQRIREVIDHVVRQRTDQGQLRDAPLTLRQLETVKDSFARVLMGMHHARIDYPASGGGVSAEFAAT